jgi:hypothetical protein
VSKFSRASRVIEYRAKKAMEEAHMASWQDQAQRGLTLFEGDGSGEGERTRRLLTHVLDEDHRDEYISRDFFNVKQTAGGLPPGFSFDQFLSRIAGHIRPELESFGDDLSDEDFRASALTFDDVIRRHIRFLNGVVHQIAPGDVHVRLWELILNSRSNARSVYSCYRDFLVDA